MSVTAAAAPIAVKSATGVLTAAGVWSGVAVVVVAMIGAVVAYIKIMPRLKELETAEKSGLRREFIDEMHALRNEVTGLREDNTALRGEVKGLRNENEILRKEIRELHGVIDGMRRENQAAQISGQRAIVETLKSLPVGPVAHGNGEPM